MEATNLLPQWLPLAAAFSLLAYIVGLAIYRRYLHPLHNVPGPFLPAVTYAYKFWANVISSKQLLHRLEHLHTIYGPIVRISPDEVHISDPTDYDKIYNVTSDFHKSAEYYSTMGLESSAFQAISNEDHRRRRQPTNPYFSRKSVLQLEDIVRSKALKLCRMIQANCDDGNKPTDLYNVFRATVVDIVTDFAFDDCWDLLNSPDLGRWWSTLFKSSGSRFYTMQMFPFLLRPTRAVAMSFARILSPDFTWFLRYEERVMEFITDVKSKIDSGQRKPKRKTVLDALLNPDNLEVSVEQTSVKTAKDQVMSFVGAATDTAANAMIVSTCHVLENPDMHARLKEELRTEYPDPNTEMKSTDLEKLPYLTGVIKEGLRLSYGVISRLARTTGKDGATLQGYYIPPGMNVSMSAWAMHRDPTMFPEPDKFDPTRWIVSDENPDEAIRARDKYLVPFSRGQRMCIGFSLAQCEIHVILASVFRQFEHLKITSGFTTHLLAWELIQDNFTTAFPALGWDCPRFEVSIGGNADSE